MSRIILDEQTIAGLREKMQTVNVYDAAGNKVAFLTPLVNMAEYKELGPEISDDELIRRMNSGERRYKTSEVLDMLKDL